MTVRFKNELVRNITIKLGYANAKVRSYTILEVKKMILLCSRSTSVKMKHVQDQGAIVPIVQTKKTIHHVNDLDVDKE
jgi:translation initiation factor 2 gamma subunit (eIF-2gamma)